MSRIWLDCGFEIKAASEDGRIEGYGAVFGNVDLGFDRIERGAFKDALRDLNGSTIPMLWQHRDDQPIGVWDSLSENRRGLKVSGQINLDTQQGREARSLAKQGAVKGLSIGYAPKDFSYEDEVRVLQSVKLYEVSLATFPMNPEAGVLGLKNMSRKEIEQTLRDELGMSRYLASRAAYQIAKIIEDESRRDSREDESTEIAQLLRKIKEELS